MSQSPLASRAPSHEPTGRRYPWIVPVLCALLAILLFLGSTVYFAYARLDGNFQSEDIDIYLDREPETDEEGDIIEPFRPGEAINILIIGSDSRDGISTTSEVTGMRSDTTMLAHISADRERVEIISLPRDTLVDIPSCRLPDGTWTQPRQMSIFNSAFATGGQTDDVGAAAACTIRTVEDLTGLYIDGFVVVNFSSFEQFVDALGGVEMCFEEALEDSAADLSIPAGCQTLNGEQALAFARARKGIGDGSDIGRMDRQQELVLAIVDEALNRNILTNIPSLYRLVDAVSQSVVTDSELGNMDTLIALANSLRNVKTNDMFLMTMPWDPAGARVLPSENAQIVWDALDQDIPLETVITPEGEPIVEETLEPTDGTTEDGTIPGTEGTDMNGNTGTPGTEQTTGTDGLTGDSTDGVQP